VKAILVMFDSLNRHMLPPYGCDWVHAPNFKRLAGKTVTFDRSFVGSMPCMPARRELHTGRYNFLHRSWGPIEPFDDSMPELLSKAGIYTHLVSDHYHYWEEGGCNYHTRYNSWEISRGQEGDPWKGDLNDPDSAQTNSHRPGAWNRQDWVNRAYMQHESDQPQAKTFRMGAEFLRTNHARDNWFLHIETFDPHEPYFTQSHYRDLYPQHDFRPLAGYDWPDYRRVKPGEEALAEHLRYCNAALISMCDNYLGQVLDRMDRYDLWKDTLLIVNTDHGFLLGEHDFWAKCVMPFWNEVAQTPLFIWDPRTRQAGVRRRSLVQTIDLAPTLLDFFGQPIPADMQGRPLRQTILDDTPVREGGLYGLHGGHVNVTDGRHTYMRAPASPDNAPLYEYTLMPTHMRHTFEVSEMRRLSELAEPFTFTKGCRTMKIPSRGGAWAKAHEFGTLLYDTERDPTQQTPIRDEALERRMTDLLIRLLRESDAPPEQFHRLGLRA
jgi:arylsulfatase A-like enzyme